MQRKALGFMVTAIGLASCSGDPGPSGMTPGGRPVPDAEPNSSVVCSPFTAITARLVSGSVSFTVDGGPVRAQALSPADPPIEPLAGSGRCGFGAFVTIVYPEGPNNPPSGPWPETRSSFSVVCDLGPVTLQTTLSSFDPSRLSPGEYERAADYGTMILVKLLDQGSCSRWSQMAMRVHVTQAVGGSAPFPAAVTPDYRREFDIHLESKGMMGGDDACPRATLNADLRLVQTAADAAHQPRPMCGLL
jgi:hypothetical protein